MTLAAIRLSRALPPALAVLALAVAAPLAGCVSAAQLRAEDEAACTSFGFQPATPGFATCLQNESLARQAYWSNAQAYQLYGPFGPYGYYPGPFIIAGGRWHHHHHWDHDWGHGSHQGWHHGGAHGWHGSRVAGVAHSTGAHAAVNVHH